MENKIEFIPYQSEHQSRCLEIFDSNCPTYFLKEERGEFEQWLTTALDSEHCYWLLLNNEQIVGCGGIYVADNNFGRAEYPNEVGFAWGMIDHALHKQGLGEALAHFRLNYLRKTYPERPIILRTTQFTYGFFEKQGFTIRQWIDDGYGIGMDKVIMEFS